MGMYKHVKKTWDEEENSKVQKQRLIQWRKEGSVVKIDNPTRIDKAKGLGYKAKEGITLARVRLRKKGRKRPKIKGGRKPKRKGRVKYSPGKNLASICEERANKKFPNLEVLSSYFVGSDSKYAWYEAILVDPNNPGIKQDNDLSWVTEKKGRTFRGKTNSGRKHRGN